MILMVEIMTGPDGHNPSHYVTLLQITISYHISQCHTTEDLMVECSVLTALPRPHPLCIFLKDSERYTSPLLRRAHCIPNTLWVASEDNLFPPHATSESNDPITQISNARAARELICHPPFPKLFHYTIHDILVFLSWRENCY